MVVLGVVIGLWGEVYGQLQSKQSARGAFLLSLSGLSLPLSLLSHCREPSIVVEAVADCAVQ